MILSTVLTVRCVYHKIFQENDLRKIQKDYSTVYLRHTLLPKVLL